MKTKHHGQMSESFLTAVFLSLSGGLQDAYTYLFRGKVFANAQTGNIVLLSTNIMDGRWDKVLHYLVPLCAFALGVLAAEKMREHFQAMQRLHWRQLVVLGEVLLLFAVGFLPQSQNLLANAIVSFSCAMQVQAFRKVNGYAFASTMCIGDLRSGVEALCIWCRTHEPRAMDRMLRYFGIILLFAPGLVMLDRLVCITGIAIFLAFTAYDTQKIKAMYNYYAGYPDMLEKASVFSALQLYLDFLNLFLYLLRYVGKRRN